MLTKHHPSKRSALRGLAYSLLALPVVVSGNSARASLDQTETPAANARPTETTQGAQHLQPFGGSSDILKVKAEDAAIVALSGKSLLELRLETRVHDILWQGVMDGTYEYLCIDGYCFFLDYSPTDNELYAYDWLGLQYLVRRKVRVAWDAVTP